ncbi:MAG TPA: hypothetical protein VGG15_02975 [Terriglobales bacterium]|jgi:hypothetical protein
MKSVWILLLGCGAIAEFFLLLYAPGLAIEIFAVVLLGMVLAGFCIRGQDSFLLGLPPIPVAGIPFMEGMTSATYPQVFLFRVELRNLYLLFAVAFYGLALLAIGFAGLQASIFSYYAPIGYGLVLSLTAIGTALVWVKERRLVRLRHVSLGSVKPSSGMSAPESYSYQFWDKDGERRGNCVLLRPALMSKPQPLTPVFFDPSDPDFNKAGFSFVFHKFIIVDSRHAPRRNQES